MTKRKLVYRSRKIHRNKQVREERDSVAASGHRDPRREFNETKSLKNVTLRRNDPAMARLAGEMACPCMMYIMCTFFVPMKMAMTLFRVDSSI